MTLSPSSSRHFNQNAQRRDPGDANEVVKYSIEIFILKFIMGYKYALIKALLVCVINYNNYDKRWL